MAQNIKRNKTIIIMIVLVFLIGIVSYKVIGTYNIKKKTTALLETKGYVASDIKKVTVTHSFCYGLIFNHEWSIVVTLVSEPSVSYSFSYKNKEVIYRGIYDSTKSKEELKKLEDKFKQGQLQNNSN